MLRSYQIETDRQLREAYKAGHTRIMIQSPTGSGKTKLAGHLTRNALEKGKRVVFVVPYISLIEQTLQSFYADGITDVGVIQADNPIYNPFAYCQVASIDTLSHRKVFPRADVVIYDEAHIQKQHIYKWMENPDVVFLGLTATPWAKGLGKHWQTLVIGSTVNQLIDEGYLSDFVVYAPSTPDLDGLKVNRSGDYKEKDVAPRVIEPKLIGSIVRSYCQRHGEGKTILYAVNRLHAKACMEAFNDAGIPAAYADAHTPIEEREEIAKQLQTGEVQVVCNVGVFVAGVDWDIRCVILATPSKSEIKVMQCIGRGLRRAEGKERLIILDHAGIHVEPYGIGFVTDIHRESLDDNDKPESERKVLPKTCAHCGAVRKGLKCSECGHEVEQPKNTVFNKKGELVELKAPKYTTREKQEIWAQLQHVAAEKGYKQGWVYHTMMDMVGSTPRDRNLQPMPPGEKVKNFLKHKQIRFAKARQKKLSAAC